MADGLMAGFKGQGARCKPQAALCALCLVSCLLSPPAVCADLDPTRPPAGLGDPLKKPEAADVPLQVCSVFLMGKNSYALVAGQTVRVGDRLNPGSASGGRVTRIDESGLWFRTTTGLRQLRLLPQVKKTPPGKMEK